MTLTPLTRLRIVGLLEGVSFLLLLGVAMPLKYYADYPMAVTVVGAAHGALFILFGLATLDAWVKVRWWSALWTLAAFVASVLPFGTFVLDGAMRRREMREAATK
jgi:integral membrane protein